MSLNWRRCRWTYKAENNRRSRGCHWYCSISCSILKFVGKKPPEDPKKVAKVAVRPDGSTEVFVEKLPGSRSETDDTAEKFGEFTKIAGYTAASIQGNRVGRWVAGKICDKFNITD